MRAGERVYRALREEIVAWRLAPGTELSEVDQAERWGVSRTPLREALGRLAGEGLAVVGKGRTLVVSALDRDDVVHLFELREALETQAARLAALRRDPTVFADLRDRFTTTAELEHLRRARTSARSSSAQEFELSEGADGADGTDLDAYYALVAELDTALDEAAGSPYLRRALGTLRPHVARVRRLAQDDPERLARAAGEHRLIAEAVAAGDPVLAAQATAVHLRAALDHVLAALPQVGRGDGERADAEQPAGRERPGDETTPGPADRPTATTPTLTGAAS